MTLKATFARSLFVANAPAVNSYRSLIPLLCVSYPTETVANAIANDTCNDVNPKERLVNHIADVSFAHIVES